MLNRVVLMGRLTADPEHKTTPSGVAVTSFSIAVERNFADKTTGTRPVDFINIVAWRGTADMICRFFRKGSLIALEGSIQTRKYQDRDGNNRIAFEVVADQVYFTGEKSSDRPQSQPRSDFPIPETFNEPEKGKSFSVGDFEEIDSDDDDLPF